MSEYNFPELTQVLREFGVDPDKGNSTFKPIREIFEHKTLKEKVQINEDGIFYTDEEGRTHKGFLYIEKGYNKEAAIERGWGTIVPKFHICNCTTINAQKSYNNFDGHYVFSNTPVFMIDIDDVEKDLVLCKNCINEINNINRRMNSTDYCKDFIQNPEENPNFYTSDIPKDIRIDEYGYTENWDEKSREYRMKMKFTCEKCGIQLNGSYIDGYFLETHHISGIKSDNRSKNLKCLCVLCHAFSDEIHLKNYKKGTNHRKLKEFLSLYSNKLGALGNPYIEKCSWV